MGKMFCPRCKSIDVRKELGVLLAIGAPQAWVCNKCGYAGDIFPEKEIKSKLKRNQNGKKIKK